MEPSSPSVRIEYLHASKYGNGARVAEEFAKQMASQGAAVTIHHIRDVNPKEMPEADLYVFSSPGRLGRPRWGVRRFLKKVQLPSGTKYAIVTTEMPTPEERTEWQHIIPIMNETLQEKGLVNVAQGTIVVTGLKGPLEEGWQTKVQTFASQIPLLP